MYSGTTFRNKSGHVAGTHQRIDRLARRNLRRMEIDDRDFPTSREILHFEGKNGPDGIKRKSPGRDEPWHFIDPSNPDDQKLKLDISEHHANLVVALREDNHQRAAFEAAWLAHAIVDGLTPAHHYPLSDKIEELWGHPKEDRSTLISKNLIRTGDYRQTVSGNWEYWGAKGVFATHLLFEWGVVSSMSTHRFMDTLPSQSMIAQAAQSGYISVFDEAVHRIYDLNLYEEFWKRGWSSRLAKHTRNSLIPEIIVQVTLAWYDALQRSES